MPKINQEEYEVLKEALNEGYEWIARDSHDPLCTHRHKPIKQDHWIQQYWGNVGNGYKEIDDRLFQFIQWEDEEPYSIYELIKEYEKELMTSIYEKEKATFEAIAESEETEVSKQKLIDKWEEAIEEADFYGKGKEERLISYMKEFVHDLNQLDEPETLSQEWIERNTSPVDDEGRLYVWKSDLQNLLVPKQEEITHKKVEKYLLDRNIRVIDIDVYEKMQSDLAEFENKIVIEKPVIPQFVADWIESEDYHIEELFEELKRDTLPKSVNRWLVDNRKSEENSYGFVARLFINGYTVKEEPKHYALIKGHKHIGSDEKYWNYCITDESLDIGDNEIHPYVVAEYIFKATKDEWANLGINDDNADFVKVEELEDNID